MAVNGAPDRSRRETRLLVLIVVVSLGVLLVLARFRFPAATLTVAPPVPSPLANLASRAAFSDLSAAMISAFDRIAPVMTAVRLEPAKVPADRDAPAAAPRLASKVAPALRVRPDLALVVVPEGLEVTAMAESGQPAEVVASNADRGIALVRVPSVAEPRVEMIDGFGGFAYVVEVTAIESGPSVQPVFVGRTVPRGDARWSSGLLGVDGPGLEPGAFVFSLEGRLLGLVLGDARGPLIVPPSAIDAGVNDLVPAAGTGSGS
jgi:hypothetical protein